MLPTVNIIAAGKLGKSLSKLLVSHQAATLLGICNRELKNSFDATHFAGAGLPYDNLLALMPSDIVFITAPDHAISQIANNLIASPCITKNTTVAHCSGAHPARLLTHLQQQTGCAIASAHPAYSFANPLLATTHFAGTSVILEGDARAIAQLTPLFTKIGAHTLTIQPEGKALYHTGTSIAANFLVTLATLAEKCLLGADLSATDAQNLLLPLMQSVLDNLKSQPSFADALTGPIARGDLATIALHQTALAQYPEIKALYEALALATTQIKAH